MELTLNNLPNIKKGNYGEYSNSNYGNHTTALKIGNRTFYFSYDTLISFYGTNSKNKAFNVVIKNYGNNTTGKHLNGINPNKKDRVNEDTFNALLKEFME